MSGALENLQVANFPGHALAANKFAGELRGYNVFAGKSGGNCVDLTVTDNPYRFYGLVASGCTIGLNLAGTQSEEFHGVSVFGNSIDVSVTGTRPLAQSYILFDGAQFQHSDLENMYLDQQNETVLCAANCEFTGRGQELHGVIYGRWTNVFHCVSSEAGNRWFCFGILVDEHELPW